MLSLRRALVVAGCLMVLLVSGSSAWSQAPKALRYQFKKGDEIPWTVEQTQIIKIANGEQNDFQSIATDVEMVWSVQDVDKDGAAKINCKLRRIRINTGGAEDQKANIPMLDSTDKDFKDNPMAKIFMPLLKDGLSCRIDPQGKVSELKVPEELQQALKEQNELAAIEAEGFVKEIFYNLCHPTALVFPADGMDKGKSWKGDAREVKFSGLFKITQQPEFTIEGQEKKDGRDLQRIAVKANIKFDAGDNEQAKVMKITVQDSKSVVLFDNQAGQIAGANLTMDYVMSVAGDANVEIRIRQFTTLKRTEKAK
jgi:hypothetical protein